MAVQLGRELRGTGVIGDHWVLVAFSVHRSGTTNDFTVSGTYSAWLNAAEYAAGKKSLGLKVQVSTGVATGNPTFGATQTALDNAAIAATVAEVAADPDAEPPVEFAAEVKGGPLEGGSIV